jgi:hypothetical protein
MKLVANKVVNYEKKKTARTQIDKNINQKNFEIDH